MISKCRYDSNLLKIAKEFNATDLISKIIAFQPPKKANYRIEFSEISCCVKTKQKHCCRFKKVNFIQETFNDIKYDWIKQDCYTFKKTNKKASINDKNIVILHIQNKNKVPGGYTILFSHGNSSTLGTMYSTFIDLSTQLKCDLLCYDYSGYGRSEGKPSEKAIYSDIEEVGYFANYILNIPPTQIILLGHSLGSAPSVHLAITPNFRDVRAIILLSPIASGVRLVSPDLQLNDLEKIDVFCNIKKIVDVSCPVFLIHGRKDEVIPIEQSVQMSKFIKNLYEWNPRNGDHFNILTKYRNKFIQKCKFFFEFLNCYPKKNSAQNSKENSVKQSNTALPEFMIKSSKNLISIRDSYFNNNLDVMKPKGNCFSLKEISKVEESLGSPKVVDADIQHTNQNPYNSQVKDYPFDVVSMEPDGLSQKSSDTLQDKTHRDSSVMYNVNNKNLEEQYNNLLNKHNGI